MMVLAASRTSCNYNRRQLPSGFAATALTVVRSLTAGCHCIWSSYLISLHKISNHEKSYTGR